MKPAPVLHASLPPFAVKLLKLIGRLVAEKAHAQVIVNVRDGKIQFFTVTQTYQPDNLPE